MSDVKPIPPPALDGLTNVMTGLGGANSKRSYNQWQQPLYNNFQQLDACYASSWLARKIVDIPAEDMTREWRRIKTDGAEEIASLEKEFHLPILTQEAMQWAGLYGGAGVLMITNQDLTKPLRPEAIRRGDLKGMRVFDRFDLSAMTINTWDVLADNYLLPEFYTLRGGAQQIHHSHVARFVGEKLPLRQMSLTQGWGDSTLRKCMEDVMDMVAAKDGIAELMQAANVDIISREGLNEELTTDQDDAIIKRYQLFRMMLSNVQMALLDGDEKYERNTLNLSGVAPIIEQFITWISAASDIPVTRMFGTSAKGLNATGDGDDKNYRTSIRAKQMSKLSIPMRKIDEVLVRSAIGSFPDSYDYEWNPLSLPTDLEAAQAQQLRAQTHTMYLDANLATRAQVMRELQADESYQYDDDELERLEEMEASNLYDETDEEDDPIEYANRYVENMQERPE